VQLSSKGRVHDWLYEHDDHQHGGASRGIKIASLFILGIVLSSLVSRTLRSTELRVHGFVLDDMASQFIAEADRSESIRIIANRPDDGSVREYEDKVREARNSHHLALDDSVLFLEVRPGDASQFTEVLKVEGAKVGPYRVLRCQSPAIPTRLPRCCCTSAISPGTCRTCTLDGPRETRSPTC